MRLLPLTVLALCAGLFSAPPVRAEEGGSALRLGGDLFAAGDTVTLSETGLDDVFLAGDDVRLAAGVRGTALLAGRDVSVTAALPGDVYAAGYDVTLGAPVAGDATLAGYAVTAGPVGGDLRATGRRVTLSGPVGGYAALAGDRVRIDAPVDGDLALTAREVTFGPLARVGGRVILVTDAGEDALVVPERVAPADRVERLTGAEAAARPDVPRPRPDQAAERGFGAALLNLVLLTALVTLAAVLLPERMARARARLLARPWAALALGAAAMSALMGAVVLAAATVLGLVLVPLLLLAVPVAGLAGYLVGTHALGVRLTAALGLPAPATAPAQARAAAAGVLALALAGLVPLLGWIVVLAVSLAGLAMLLPPLQRAPA